MVTVAWLLLNPCSLVATTLSPVKQVTICWWLAMAATTSFSSAAALTARTVVNRLWKPFFGTALSRVPADLGAQGELPPNQALLDWLAVEFRDGGRSLKGLHRLLVTSETYRQASVGDAEAAREA